MLKRALNPHCHRHKLRSSASSRGNLLDAQAGIESASGSLNSTVPFCGNLLDAQAGIESQHNGHHGRTDKAAIYSMLKRALNHQQAGNERQYISGGNLLDAQAGIESPREPLELSTIPRGNLLDAQAGIESG